MIVYNRNEYSALSLNQYRKEKYRLQLELLKVQEWVLEQGKRIAIIFEGRDAAGKGSTIKRFVEHLMPKGVDIVELGVPSKKQDKRWFLTWEKRLPKKGKIVFYDRSWYSRAIIQPSMGYCNEAQYNYFMKKVNKWEKKLMDGGLTIIKFYLSISKENQEFRFHKRETHTLKYWKLSPNDWKAYKNWHIITSYKNEMFRKTSTESSPWVAINSNNKMIARLNAMRYVLKVLDYPNKKALKQKKWSKENPTYNISVKGTSFNNLSQKQYSIICSLLPYGEKAHAAGGVVLGEGKVLFIKKNNRWELPKGRVSKGKSNKKTALKEISEETGLPKNKLKIICELIPTHHNRNIEKKKIVKEIMWYLVSFKGNMNTKLIPDKSENITDCVWIEKKHLYKPLEKSHRHIQYLIDYAKQNNDFKKLIK